MRKPIYVYASWKEIGDPLLMGTLYAETSRGHEVFSFDYDKSWLKSSHSILLDPNLQLYEALQYMIADDKKEMFGVFMDSSPDKWGKLLMRRREAAYAKLEDRPEKIFHSSDYLLGVYDKQRIGGLRFKLDVNGPFENSDERLATPPITRLRELEQVSLHLEDENAAEDPQYLEWLNQLIAPGSSLGGARPKAGVVDPDGHLWIAKFPSKSDFHDVGAWELIAHDMAFELGIHVPEAKIERFGSHHHTFLIKRFDREGESRLHYSSAMTMLDQVDFSEDASYLDIAEWLIANSISPNEDLVELFKRMVFNVCVSNVDDHLRNHGFLFTGSGWRLSPVFDVNPTPDGRGLRLNIIGSDNSLNLDNCLSISSQFRLSVDEAIHIIEQTKRIAGTFEDRARKLGVGTGDIQLMAQAFRNYREE